MSPDEDAALSDEALAVLRRAVEVQLPPDPELETILQELARARGLRGKEGRQPVEGQ